MSLHIIGTIYDIDSTDPDNQTATPVDGWHVNSTEPLEGLDDYLVTPTVPRVVFAGVDTWFYSFESEMQAKELLNFDGENYNPTFKPKPEPVPQQVTRRQALTVIKQMGLVPQIEAALDAITDTNQKIAAETYWQESLHFERDNELLISLAEGIGLTSEPLDNLFIQAGKL